MNSKKISVVLPIYNAGELLIPCIESVLGQDYKNFEFLICDDLSTDDSYEKLLSYAEKNPGLIKLYQNQENQGLFKNLNFLLSKCESPLIKLWSQDDIMMRNCLSSVFAFHLEHPNISMSYHRVDYIDEHGIKTVNDQEDGTPEIIDVDTYCKTSIKWGCMPGNIANVTLEKRYVDKLMGFDGNYKVSGDFDMWTRLVTLAPIGRMDQSLIYLRRHQGQLSNQFSSAYFRIKEDLPIFERLLAMLPNSERENFIKIFHRKVLVHFFNETVYLIKNRQLKLAWQAQMELFKRRNALFIIFNWVKLSVYKLSNKRSSYYKGLSL